MYRVRKEHQVRSPRTEHKIVIVAYRLRQNVHSQTFAWQSMCAGETHKVGNLKVESISSLSLSPFCMEGSMSVLMSV